MSAMELGGLIVQATGWCLVHFLWQAVLIGLAYALARWLLPRGTARYVAAMLALVLLAAVPAFTFVHEWRAFASVVQLGDMHVAGADAPVVAASVGVPARGGGIGLLRVALPWLVLAWGCGVALLSLRVVRQWTKLRAIVRAAETLPVWQARAAQMGRRLGLGHAVRVLASVRIATPTLVGWVRPAVVMPMAMLARMPAEQVDWILAHELAHLRRLDHLANLFQVVLETLLFYHPVVHWISRDARRERELCCDALALHAAGGRRRDFVAALAGLEEFRAGHSDLVLAATGGLLVERAWFVAGVIPPRRHAPMRGAALVVALLMGVSLLGLAARHATSLPPPAPAHAQSAANRAPGAGISVRGAVPHRMPAPVVGAPLAAPLAGVAVATPLLPRLVVRTVPIAKPGLMQVGDLRASLPALATAALAAAQSRPQPSPAVALPAAAAPEPLHVVAPDYPRQALADGTHGRVVVAFTLDAVGRPHDVSVVSATPAGVFEAASLAAIRQWRFTPPATVGRHYRQVFSFAPAASGPQAATAAGEGCRYVTGSHICRDFSDASAALQAHAPGVH